MRRGPIAALTLAAVFAATSSGAQTSGDVRPIEERVFHVSASGHTCYVALTDGLEILDLSKPGDRPILSLTTFPQSATYAAPAGNLVFVAQGPAGVYAVDATDPVHPVAVARIDTPGSAMMVDVSDDRLAVADGSVGLTVFDIRNPKEPKPIARGQWEGYCRGAKFYLDELYVCAGTSGLVVMAATRNSIKPLASCKTRGDARDIAFHDAFAFVADGAFGLSVIDISEAAAPRLCADAPAADLAHGVACDGGVVYVADGSSGVGVFKFDPPSSLELIDRLSARDGYANKVTVHGDYLLVANDIKGVLVFDIRDRRKPKLVE